jgi:phosphoribosylformimino-5-aminoimidazole carboxamide ribotide isomerase
MSLIVYPVLDLKGGLVVHGVGGDRAGYRPIQSSLVASAEPDLVAEAFRDALGIDRLYVADLDALEGGSPQLGVLESLREAGFDLLVDSGIKSEKDALLLLGLGIDEIIAPLETLPDPAALERIVEAAGAERVVFSLDQKHGSLLGDRAGWPHPDAKSVAHEAHHRGARKLLLLDLGRVGSQAGPAPVSLLQTLARELPGVSLFCGGGIRSREDLRILEAAGAEGALVATAFHRGAITRDDLG